VPDGSFVAAGRLPGDQSPPDYIDIPPDLAFEVVSPDERAEELEEKIADFRAVDVRLIWLVHPATRTVQVRRLDRTCAEVDEAGTLSGEDVLPGFTCPVAELFA
jgi:Uma2 family endonuclease